MNRLRPFRLPFIFIGILAGLASCEDPEDPSGTPSGDMARIAATIDGQPFTVTGILVTGEMPTGALVNTLAIGGSTLPLGGTTEGFALALVHTDGSAFAAGQSFDAAGSTAIAAGEYLLETPGLDIRAESGNTDQGVIVLSSYDPVQQLASGTFWFDGVDDDDPSITYEIRDGIFENVPLR
jgi:hypothetical protein